MHETALRSGPATLGDAAGERGRLDLPVLSVPKTEGAHRADAADAGKCMKAGEPPRTWRRSRSRWAARSPRLWAPPSPSTRSPTRPVFLCRMPPRLDSLGLGFLHDLRHDLRALLAVTEREAKEKSGELQSCVKAPRRRGSCRCSCRAAPRKAAERLDSSGIVPAPLFSRGLDEGEGHAAANDHGIHLQEWQVLRHGPARSDRRTRIQAETGVRCFGELRGPLLTRF